MSVAAASRVRDFRPVGRPAGAVMIGIGVMIAVCGATGFIWDVLAPDPELPQGGAIPCLGAALLCVVLGVFVHRWGRRSQRESLTRRQALLAVAMIWFVAGVGGALPFVFGARLSPADALFESVSGLTTTGATVIGDIEERLSRPILLWRSMAQWLGGMGIVVLFVAVFPSLGSGGKHLYKGEAPGAQAEGFKPRIAETSIALWKLYAAFTVLEALILSLLGMDVFEAICHALTTMSTGGFSTRDGSVGGFGVPAFEWVIAVFMLIGSVNYGLYYLVLRGRKLSTITRDVEFRTYVGIVLVATALLTLFNLDLHGGALESLRTSLFMVATTISSTGYGTTDYTQFGQAAFALMLGLMFVGGCSGSTAGGIKIERIVIIAKQTLTQIRRSFVPSMVQVVRMGPRVVPNPVIADVMSFFAIYLVTILAGAGLVATIENVPVPTAFGAMLTCVSNMGPAPFHDLAGLPDNFSQYSSVSKIIGVVAMLLGRLEFFTLLALLLPGFWKR